MLSLIVCGQIRCYAIECLVISLLASPCLSLDPPPEGDLGWVAPCTWGSYGMKSYIRGSLAARWGEAPEAYPAAIDPRQCVHRSQ